MNPWPFGASAGGRHLAREQFALTLSCSRSCSRSWSCNDGRSSVTEAVDAGYALKEVKDVCIVAVGAGRQRRVERRYLCAWAGADAYGVRYDSDDDTWEPGAGVATLR
jgi:hypothetical protein